MENRNFACTQLFLLLIKCHLFCFLLVLFCCCFFGGPFDFIWADGSPLCLSFLVLVRRSIRLSRLVLVVDDPFLAGGVLDFVFDLIGSNSSNAQQRVLEVRANLAGHLTMSSLHLAAKSS